MSGLPLLVRLFFASDFLFDLNEMIIGVTEGIVDLREGQMRIGVLDGFDRVTSPEAQIDEPHRNAGPRNDRVPPPQIAGSLCT